ncbi:MAG: hypothetical protein ACMG51_06080 [Ginsengibacter sp.]
MTHPIDARDPVQGYLSAAGTALPAIAGNAAAGVPVMAQAVTGLRALGGALGQQMLANAGAPEWAQDAVGVLSNKTGISSLTRAGAGKLLTNLESNASPRVAADLANAETVAPGQQTFAQTTGSPFLAKIGLGAAGKKTAEASATIVDNLTNGMQDQANRIAALPLSHPQVAADVHSALLARDADLADRQNAVYTAGRKAAAKEPGTVATTNTVAAVDQMLKEGSDPTNLAPPEVTKRLQNLADSLRPQEIPQAPVPGTSGLIAQPNAPIPRAPMAPPAPVMTPGGTTWGGFYDLRKQINTLYDSVPKDQITPAMNATFSRLKQGYFADLAAAPDGPAKVATTRANQIYSGIADKREMIKNSIASTVLGKDGMTSIADPDSVLDRFANLKPAAQSYVQRTLAAYSPQTLDAIRSYVITKNVQSAARTGGASTASRTNPDALTPGRLADSGWFTPEQGKELGAREDALRIARTALPEKGAPVAEATPQSVGRIIGGGFNSTFVGGALANMASSGALEKLLNTPEGRNTVLAPSFSREQNVNEAVKAYQAALLAQVAADRTQNAPPPQAPPAQ